MLQCILKVTQQRASRGGSRSCARWLPMDLGVRKVCKDLKSREIFPLSSKEVVSPFTIGIKAVWISVQALVAGVCLPVLAPLRVGGEFAGPVIALTEYHAICTQ